MSARFGFPRQARLTRQAEFQRIYRLGRRLKAPPLRLVALRRPDGKSRLGLAVSRKVGGAVVRNRYKRAIREAFRLHRHRLSRPYDMAVSVGWEAAPEEVKRVEAAFLELVEMLNAADGEAPAQ